MATDIGPRIGIQGEAEYRKTIQNLIQQQKTLKSEMQATASAFDKDASAKDKNKAKTENLTKSIEVQKQRVQELEKMVQQSAEKYGEADTRTLKWKEALNNATAELNRMENELRNMPSQVEMLGKSFEEAGEKLTKIGDQAVEVGGKLTKYLTVPIAGAFAAATKSALTFEDGMAKVYTIADDTVVPMEDMADALLQVSNNTGMASSDIAEAAYQALSASVDTEHAAEFTERAARLAKAGFLDTAGAVDVLTTIINAYGYSADHASMIADQLIQVQNDGKTTVQQLAQSMGTVIPIASALNVPLEQINAAYAVMTKQGINTAETTTYLRSMMNELSRSGSETSKILTDQTGMSFAGLMASGYSLADVLKVLYDGVEQNDEAFKNLFGNVRAGQGALAIANGGIDEFNAEVDKMTGSIGNVDKAVETLSTNGAAMRKAMNELKNAAIEIGDRFAPLVGTLATGLTNLIHAWDAMPKPMQDVILTIGGIVAAVGPLLMAGGKLLQAAGTITTVIGKLIPVVSGLLPVITAINPAFLLVAAGIAAAVAAGIYIAKHWDEIKEAAVIVVDAIKAKWNEFVTGFKNVVENVKSFTANLAASVKAKFDAMAAAIGNVVQNIRSKIDAVREKFDALREKVESVVSRIKSALNFSWKIPHIPMPHFTITGEFRINPPSVPHFSVSWYKKAYNNPMMFTSPTVIPTANGLKGFGDGHGGEIVIGKETMYAMIRDAVASGGDTYGDINVVVNGAPGQDVRELADLVADRINERVQRRRAAFA